ncbi:transcriptional regulator with XRE-family HTH domain [Nocardioides sp. BE266]|uniref:helix-turn-helix domain-containing protein n=1 Tax=Nocardioides sp. BE266 TaxID=2817725 RepID=UPI002856DF35|nr:helix-turn-helix transcriptional regulator [Nocardioides sp. BE266]MDR7253757.1 transcriptional regulator with XRE-family HTH domain [Nocardioides sp. BE266]
MTTQAQERIPAVTLKWRLQMSLDEAGISVEEAAARMDVSRSTISRWLNGRGTAPKRPFLAQWALMTGVPVEWLENGEGTGTPTPPDGGEPSPGVDTAIAKLAAGKRSATRGATTGR